MIMYRFLTLVTSIAALGFAASPALAQPPEQLSALDQQIETDSNAIAQDKLRMDQDARLGNAALYRQDKSRLYNDTEVQETHRGTERDSTIGWDGHNAW
jgi:hypothetical protein